MFESQLRYLQNAVTSAGFYKIDCRMQYISKYWKSSKYKFFMQENLGKMFNLSFPLPIFSVEKLSDNGI